MRHNSRLTACLIGTLTFLVGAAGAEPLLTQGGSLSKSRFCGKYSCQSLGAVPANAQGTGRAYRLKAEPSVGLISRVKGGDVNAMNFVILNPAKLSDAKLLRVLGTILPDFQRLSLGSVHKFKVSQACLKSPTTKKVVTVAKHKFAYRCVYNDASIRPEVRTVYKLPKTAGFINVQYGRP